VELHLNQMASIILLQCFVYLKLLIIMIILRIIVKANDSSEYTPLIGICEIVLCISDGKAEFL